MILVKRKVVAFMQSRRSQPSGGERPGKSIFAKSDFKEAFKGQDIHWQAGAPQSEAESQRLYACKREKRFGDGDLENAIERGVGRN